MALSRRIGPSSTYRYFGTLVTGTTGSASIVYRPATNTTLSAYFGGPADPAKGQSNTVRVLVRQLAILRPTNLGHVATVPRGTTVSFVTTVRPIEPTPARVSYVVYRYVNGAWKLYTRQERTADARGRAAFTWRFGTAGQWYVRSVANPTPYNANSYWTPPERYSVR